MAFSWAAQKRLSVVLIIAAIVLTLAALILIPLLYESPSCTDGKQNQDERGIDCGGSACPYMCAADILSPSVRFVRTLAIGGRTDVIAFIDNRNARAEANEVRYTLELFDEHGVAIGRREGVVDLPAGMTVPLFIPGVSSQEGARAFLTLEEQPRFREVKERPYAPLSEETRIEESAAGTRVVATIKNNEHEPVFNAKYVVVLYDAAGTIIGASQTVVTLIPADGSQEAVFTWPASFKDLVSRVEILPLVPVR